MNPLDRNRRLAALLITLILVLWASSSWAATIGIDSTFDLARTVVLTPEYFPDGTPNTPAIEFNAGFTLTAFFGQVALYCRFILEAVK